MNIQAFARTVKSDADWTVTVHLSKSNDRNVCSIWAYHAFGGMCYLTDGFFINCPLTALQELSDLGIDYRFTDSTSSALLAELGLMSGDPEPVQSVEQPNLSTETVDNFTHAIANLFSRTYSRTSLINLGLFK